MADGTTTATTTKLCGWCAAARARGDRTMTEYLTTLHGRPLSCSSCVAANGGDFAAARAVILAAYGIDDDDGACDGVTLGDADDFVDDALLREYIEANFDFDAAFEAQDLADVYDNDESTREDAYRAWRRS